MPIWSYFTTYGICFVFLGVGAIVLNGPMGLEFWSDKDSLQARIVHVALAACLMLVYLVASHSSNRSSYYYDVDERDHPHWDGRPG